MEILLNVKNINRKKLKNTRGKTTEMLKFHKECTQTRKHNVQQGTKNNSLHL